MVRLCFCLCNNIGSKSGESIGATVWAGCLAALTGSVLMSLSHSGADVSDVASGIATGDALLVGAALLWSVQVPPPAIFLSIFLWP